MMVEVLQFIFLDLWNYLGTLILIMTIGIAGGVITSRR